MEFFQGGLSYSDIQKMPLSQLLFFIGYVNKESLKRNAEQKRTS